MNNLILIGIGLGLRQNLYFATGENTNILGHKSTFCAVVKSIFFFVCTVKFFSTFSTST